MKRKWLFIVLRYGLGFLIVAGVFWGFVILYNDNNWLGISALATLLLALGAFETIRQNHQLHARERRERLLNEIIEWAIDIQKVSLEVDIPVNSVSLSKEQRRGIEANVLLRYGIPFIRNE